MGDVIRAWSSEDDLHKSVASYLRAALVPGAIFNHQVNEGRDQKNPAWRRKQASLGTMFGWPDLQIIHNGKPIFIELKVGRNRLTESQTKCHAALRAAGCDAYVCRSLEDVEAVLRPTGALSEAVKLMGQGHE